MTATTRGVAPDKVVGIGEAIGRIPEGSLIGTGGVMFQRKPLALCRELAAAGPGGHTLVSFTATLDAEILAAAGRLEGVAAAHVGLERLGRPPAISAQRDDGTLQVLEHSEYTLMRGLNAAVNGLPFLPSFAPMGSDIVEELGLQTVTCPYTQTELLAIPAIAPDVALVHAWRADPEGFVQWPWPPDGVLDFDMLLARAASTVICSVEEIVSSDVVRRSAAYTRLAGFEVDVIVEAPGGAAPGSCRPSYTEDWNGLMTAVREAV